MNPLEVLIHTLLGKKKQVYCVSFCFLKKRVSFCVCVVLIIKQSQINTPLRVLYYESSYLQYQKAGTFYLTLVQREQAPYLK